MTIYSKVARNGQITLPVSVRKRLGVSEGDIVEIEVEKERVIVTPKKLIDSSQSYFWTKDWQQAEKEAENDIKNGKVRVFDSAVELLQELDA